MYLADLDALEAIFAFALIALICFVGPAAVWLVRYLRKAPVATNDDDSAGYP